MKKIKQLMRLVSLVILILLASCGVGITGTLFGNKERYMNNEIKTEQVEKKEEEESDEKE